MSLPGSPRDEHQAPGREDRRLVDHQESAQRAATQVPHAEYPSPPPSLSFEEAACKSVKEHWHVPQG